MLALMDAVPDSPALIISLDGNQVVRKQLMQCVEKVLYIMLIPTAIHTLPRTLML